MVNEIHCNANSAEFKAMSDFCSSIQTKRTDLASVLSSFSDSYLDETEFSAIYGNATKFTEIFNRFRSNADAADVAEIQSNEVFSLWSSLDSLGDANWISIMRNEPVKVGEKTVGTMTVKRRTVPKGSMINGLSPTDSEAWRSVHKLRMSVKIDKTKLNMTSEEMAKLIYSVADYDLAMTTIEDAYPVEGDGKKDYVYSEFDVPKYIFCDGYDVIHMTPPQQNGTNYRLKWYSGEVRDGVYFDFNTFAPSSHPNCDADTVGTWDVSEGDAGVGIEYEATVDVPNVKGSQMGASDNAWGAVSDIASGIVEKTCIDLVNDTLRLADAYVKKKEELITLSEGRAVPSYEEIKAQVMSSYQK